MKLNKTQLGEKLSVSRQTVYNYLRKPDAPLPDKKGRYDLGEVQDYITAKMENQPSNKSEWQRLCQLRADLLGLELAEKKGLLVTQESVDQRDSQQNEILTNEFSSFPGKVAFKLEGKTTVEIEAALKQEINAMILHLRESKIAELKHP